MILSILLLVLLFIVGFINIFFHLPIKKLCLIVYSFCFDKKSSATTSAVTTSTPQAPSNSGKSHARRKEELKRVFATFDKNGDGFITKEELLDSLKSLRLSIKEKEVHEMVSKVDINKDGLIDFEEFQFLVQEMKLGGEGEERNGAKEEEELKEAFDVFDKDRDGLISAEELGLILRSMGLKEGRNLEDVKEMIRKVDIDGDGMANFDEFKKMMKSRGGVLS